MSQARAHDEQVWLRARLEELRGDVERFARKADECGLGGVAATLNAAKASVDRAERVTAEIIAKRNAAGEAQHG